MQTTFDIECDDVCELQPGQALIVNKAGECSLTQIIEPKEVKACSFERIYFSRGSDRDIYSERKKLGELLTPDILKAINMIPPIPCFHTFRILQRPLTTGCFMVSNST